MATARIGIHARKGTPKANGRPIVVSYLRFSKLSQADGDSIRRQTELSERWAAAHGVSIDRSLSDRGVSAFRGKNAQTGALAEFLNLVRSGTIPQGSTLLVESLDRLSRNELLEALELFLGIVNLGVKIVTLGDGFQYDRENMNLQNLMYSLMVMSRGHEESQRKSQRNAAAWTAKRRSAMNRLPITSLIPTWLEVEGAQFKIKAAAARAVRHAFQLALEGYGCTTIARKLQAKHEPIGRAGHWRQSYVKHLLHNRAVIGEWQPHKLAYENGKRKRVPIGDPIAEYFPAVIDAETFMAVQAAVRRRRRTGGRSASYVNLLQGFHSSDGSRIRLANMSGYRYYVAASGAEGMSDSLKAVPVAAMEVGLLLCLDRLADRRSEQTAATIALEAAKERLTEIEERIDSIIAAATTERMSSSASLLKMMAHLDSQKDAAQAEVERLQSETSYSRASSTVNWSAYVAKAFEQRWAAEERLMIRENLRRMFTRLVVDVERLSKCRSHPHKRIAIVGHTADGRSVVFGFEYKLVGGKRKLEVTPLEVAPASRTKRSA